MATSRPQPSKKDRRDRIELLLADCIDRLNSGETVDKESLAREHPDLAADLLRELETFERLGPGAPGDVALGTIGGYRLLRKLGRGGMGVVYEAWEEAMERPVALKVLPGGLLADLRTVARFQNEARAAGKLQHQNLVHVFGMGVDGNTPFFAMEYVEGETLERILRRRRRVDGKPAPVAPPGSVFEEADLNLARSAKLAEAFADVADGLQHAHQRGVVHRDIKPSNLIADGKGRLRILDFGLARLEGQEGLTLSGDLLGTPNYMSPEQARVRKSPVDYRTDIYSLGATLYEVLTGQPPFVGRDHQDTLSRIITWEPTPPRRFNHRVPLDLETIVLKCLEKEPGARYGTAEALGQDLRRFARGDPIEARPRAAWEKLARRVTRQKARFTALLVMLAMALALVGLTWGRFREAERRRTEAYSPAVRSAVELLQVAALGRRADAWEPPLLDLRGSVLGRGHSGGGRGATGPDPAAEAVRILREASQLQPERPEAYYYLAKGLLLLGDQVEAARELERAARASPGFVPALILRAGLLKRQEEEHAATALEREAEARARGGWAEAWLLARRLLREGRWKEAIDASSRLIANNPRDGEPYVGAGMEARLLRAAARLEDEDVGRALQDLAVVRHLWPTALEPALLEAKAFRLLGREDIAERLLNALHAAAEFKDDVALGIIALYAVSSTRDEAKALEWAEKLSPGFLREWNRAESLAALGRDEEAVQAGRAAVEFEADQPDARATLALTLYQRLGRYPEALEVLDEGIERNPANALLHYHRGCVHFRWGQLEKAVASFREAARLDPREARLQADLGLTLVRSGEGQHGLAALAEAIAIDRGLSYAQNNMGLALSWMGRLDEARTALDEASRLDPGWSWPCLNRASICERQGSYAEAIAEYRKARDGIPKSPSAYAGLVRLLAQEGRQEEAVEVCTAGLELFPADPGLNRELTEWLLGDSRSMESAQLERLHRAVAASPGPPGEVNRISLALLANDAQRAGHVFLPAPVPSYLAMDIVLETGNQPCRDQALKILALLGARTAASDPVPHLLYLEGRLFQFSGRSGEAADRFFSVVAADPAASEPVLRLAECRRAAGDPQSAAAHLRHALDGPSSPDPRLWVLWAGIQFAELGRTPAEVLQDLPLAAGGLGLDLRWLIDRLVQPEAIRIDCGGSGFQSRGGSLWSEDRFFAGGETGISLALEIAGTEDDLLYRTERWFATGSGPRGGYRVPVPPGEYRVTLHLAETWYAARGLRSFDVLLEGEEALPGHEPLAAGFATAHEVVLPVVVEDGILDLEFLPRAGNPQVSGVEIEKTY